MFLFSKGKIPRLIHRLGYNVKDHKLESEVPSKRKRADSKHSKKDANDSIVSESSSGSETTKPMPNTRHKLRRTKKHENLREEWKKYHNNFIPVIPPDANELEVSSNQVDNTFPSQNSSYDYNEIKYSIKDSFNKNNYIKLDDKHESKMKEHHIAKKRRLFSFIQL